MRCTVFSCCIIMILVGTTACNAGWKHTGGVLNLPEVTLYHSSDLGGISPGGADKGREVNKTAPSRRISFALPEGWHWVMRGDDFIATRNGVFLQNILVERIHVDQVEQSGEMFPFAALSSRQWPVRTLKYLKKRFTPGMPPAEAAEVILSSRENNPGIADFEAGEISMQTIAGHQGFQAVYGFRLDVQGRKTPYRTLSCGFMLDDWFYGISYTAAKRYYFQKDAEAFNSFLQSFRLVEK